MDRRILGVLVVTACIGAVVLVGSRRPRVESAEPAQPMVAAKPPKPSRAPSGAVAIDAPTLQNAAIALPISSPPAVDGGLAPTQHPEGRGAGQFVPTPRRVIDRGVL